MSTHRAQVLIVGGGASGLCAAITAARCGAEVLVLEKTAQVLKKLSMTGNGRCNLSNMELELSQYHTAVPEQLQEYLDRFGLNETLDFFAGIGVVVQNEGGYLYPAASQATAVTEALMRTAHSLGVSIINNAQVKRIEALPGLQGFIVSTADDEYTAQSVILACGGLSGTKACGCTGDGYYLATQLGLHTTDTYPALAPLRSDDETLPKEHGVRAFACVTFQTKSEDLATETGELQLSKGAISGIPAMQASGEIARALKQGEEVLAKIDFFPSYDEELFESLKEETKQRLNAESDTTMPIASFLAGFHNSDIIRMVLQKMKLSASMKIKNIPPSMLDSILDQFRKVKVPVTGAASYTKAQATKGGVMLLDLDETLCARKVPGFYLAGEVIDVDGRCGGYNLQWAWTSGTIAGEAAAAYACGAKDAS